MSPLLNFRYTSPSPNRSMPDSFMYTFSKIAGIVYRQHARAPGDFNHIYYPDLKSPTDQTYRRWNALVIRQNMEIAGVNNHVHVQVSSSSSKYSSTYMFLLHQTEFSNCRPRLQALLLFHLTKMWGFVYREKALLNQHGFSMCFCFIILSAQGVL